MATPSLLSPQDFAGKIRAKYPGAYDHLSDDDLTQRVISKYPQYGGSVQLATSGPARPNVQMENYGPTGRLPGVSEGAGLRESLGGWAGETGSDIGGGTADIARGNIARGGHRLLSAMQSATLPAAPFVAAAAPAATVRALAAGSAGGYGAGKLAELVGADPDQAALAGDVGGLVGGYAGAEAPNLTRGLGPKVGALGRLAAKDAFSHVPVAGRLVRRPSLMDYMEAAKTQAPPAPIPPELSTPTRTLPGQIGPESIRPPAAPIPPRSGLLLQGEVGQPPQSSLLDQMSAQPERRVSQQPYSGPNRRIAPEERGFLTAPPLDPERIGVDYRPAEDLGVKVRQETEAAKGPIKRGAKALKQAEALGKSPTSNKLIQDMGGQPVETVTGERKPYVPIGFREGPPQGTMVPQSSEEMQSALDMSLRRARRKP